MVSFTRLFLVVLSLSLVLGLMPHGATVAEMEQTMTSAATTGGGAMGDCDACTGKTMKSGMLCDLACNTPAAIATASPDRLDIDPLSTDYGMIANVRATGRVPAIDPSPPRTFILI